MTTKKLRIAVDARLYGGDRTGDSTYWTGLLDALAALPDLEILGFSDQMVNAPFEVCRLAAPNARMWSMVTFPLAARKRRADVIHGQYNMSPLCGSRMVTTVHDVSFFIGPEWFSPTDRILLQKGVAATVGRAKRVITVSQTSANEIEQFIPSSAGKVRPVLNGNNSRLPLQTPELVSKILREFGLGDTPYLMVVGTDWGRKNFDLAVAAYSRAFPDGQMPLVVVGKSKRNVAHPGIKKVGYVTESQLDALYQGAKLFLVPSFHEGFGIPLLEAFERQCPVLCSRGGALPEVAGDAATVAPDFEPTTWATLMTGLLVDSGKLEQMKAAGLVRATAFSWQKAAEQTAIVYCEAAE